MSVAASENLAMIAELGLREHWLISSTEVMFPKAGQILGAGGFGLVLAATLHGTAVAVKAPRVLTTTLQVECLGALGTELRILRRLRHPNIVLLHGALVDPNTGEIALVMEHIKGIPLHIFVAAESLNTRPDAPTETLRLNPKVRHSLLVDICCALRYLHAQQPCIVHGDLKSSNIMVEHPGHAEPPSFAARAKLIDFGLSRLLTPRAAPLGGTVAWMAPEVLIKKKRPTEPSSDVFSFGRVIYHVVTGVKPLSSLTTSEIVLAVRNRACVPELSWPASCPFREESSALCGAMLQFEPVLRPSTVAVHTELLTWCPIDAFCEALLRTEQHGLKAALQHARMVLSQHRNASNAPKCGKGLAAPAVMVMGRCRRALDVATGAAKQPASNYPAMGGGGGTSLGLGIAGGAAATACNAGLSLGDVRGTTAGTGCNANSGAGDAGGTATATACDGRQMGGLLLADFFETPEETKCLGFVDLLTTWNCHLPASIPGEGCCSYHALVREELSRLQTGMASQRCVPSFMPHSGWQCPLCCVLNELPDDSSTLMCETCGHAERMSTHRHKDRVYRDDTVSLEKKKKKKKKKKKHRLSFKKK
eukprot:NODE_4885_length_1834_cov_4.917985.p1 GENE.NODE_4885_length_1834_cov_4.917985~~NODE_4885_length_1834_cov_4.917985.p1  ORF type:complete len:592 (+),score=125.31 NODE_4885_length_1834_cov_4.917985:3-1778(+)